MDPTGGKSDRLLRLYPKVDENETPLPRSWNPKDKYTYLGLSNNNLKLHYKGSGNNQRDAASVRASHSIPAACGVYYFEIHVVSKGRDGYMGIGLSSVGVSLNRLPGWEKNSYGYHADDGCVFSSSATGQSYGPTFTTGDVVGCGLNLIRRSIFFTKNGINLGTATSDLPDLPGNLPLYPTVGLQTPGEIVEVNFGESPFLFDFDGMLSEMQAQTRQSIEEYPLQVGQGVWQGCLHQLVLGYLVHHGYCNTAASFAATTSQILHEDLSSIKNRQRIQDLVLRGQITQALQLVRLAYPGILESNQELLFKLRCRQFVEMIGGFDAIDVAALELSSTAEIGSTEDRIPTPRDANHGEPSSRVINGDGMEVDPPLHLQAKNIASQDTQPTPENAELGTEQIKIILAFGKDLQRLYNNITSDSPNDKLKVLLQDSFSLLAYTEPRASPVSYLLDPLQREPVCAALNSAILESLQLPGQPPLEFALGQAAQCLKFMSRNGLGIAAFTGVQDIINS